MKRKLILVVAMLDSIHTARWLSQFQNQEIDFLIVGSKKHKSLHPNLIQLLKSHEEAQFELAHFRNFRGFAGYLDFLFFIFLPRFFQIDLRQKKLTSLLNKKTFDCVHALEIQGAGYLVDRALRNSKVKVKFILTNWGSDIYYFQEDADHKIAIQSALQSATHYSAECRRDYVLARSLGFVGIELPCMPNAGGFNLQLIQNQTLASTRKSIVAKAYGGDFGRGDIVVESLSQILHRFNNTSVFLYSVTEDLIETVEELRIRFPDRVQYSGRRSPLSRDQMRELFLESRVYVGASRSDGISTSFLEALISGCYPVQTNTSCANEWVDSGAIASLVGMDVRQISTALELALTNDLLVDQAQEDNKRIAESHLSSDVIRPLALTFYSNK
jgi:glycosyltransferase involved in cell wall biosynthesis